ncbi:radical SAM family heme chaperone HemW [Geomonas sp. Red32]|uniref:radical SAM family heme chaperone HemW n=1 Tax=Geomonas sp. Red32 TaxID=2912856 RepID=UPI00202CC783|nr:radical SAM family heme chaperone HemW [Geomonas sp. Red32]MCM0084013.1 radical SAM family heme chaperone HemW [Geomonas sp. Red32]
MLTGIYLHYPFCVRKCLYCDFASTASSPVSPEAYVRGVLAEMELRRRTLRGPVRAPTLYLGGGTPSLMGPEPVAALVEAVERLFGLEPGAEVTIEANPGTLTPAKLSGYLAAGVNRLSLGVQSFDDRYLKKLGRIHTAADAVEGFEAARRAGFANLSIDLMHGLPGQSLEEWRSTLERAIALAPEHISAYGLSVEEGTPFAALKEAGALPLPEEETAAAMFEETVCRLAEAGYRHYEISNFARPGYASRHNGAYWRRESYLGFGGGAHSFLNPRLFRGQGGLSSSVEGGGEGEWGRRWNNTPDLPAYLESVAAGSLPEEEIELLTLDDAVSEAFFLGLRELDGIDLAEFRTLYGENPLERHLAEVARLEGAGLLLREGERVRLSPSTVLIANSVFARFL